MDSPVMPMLPAQALARLATEVELADVPPAVVTRATNA